MITRDPFSSPEPTIILTCDRDRELWLCPTPEVRDSRTFRQIWQIWLAENMKRILCTCSENQVRLELSIPAAGQNDRGLWGRECPWPWVSLTWLLYNLQLWCHICWFQKFTVRFWPIGKEIASSMYNDSYNYLYSHGENHKGWCHTLKQADFFWFVLRRF